MLLRWYVVGCTSCCQFVFSARSRLGRTRREAEEFIRWFEDVYYLKRLVLAGDDVRVLHAHAGDWQVRLSRSLQDT